MIRTLNLITGLLITCIAVFALPTTATAHCQVPCGIYDDYARLQGMLEDATTAEKATTKIAELADKSDPQSKNQLIRWVNNKEIHAQNIIDTISDYYLTQRVKPSQDDYAERLAKHHTVIIAAMKTKQNAEPSYVDQLAKSIAALKVYYPKHTH